MGARGFHPILLQQKHSAIVYHAKWDPASRRIQCQLPGAKALISAEDSSGVSGDALITGSREILLCVKAADCMPILLVDQRKRAIAAVHAGWRGALSRIVEKTVGDMRRTFDVRPENLVAVVGPSIRACCYEVGEEIVDAFCGRFPGGEDFFQTPDSESLESNLPQMAQRRQTLFMLQAPPGHSSEPTRRVHLDLVAVARYQLQSAGLSPSRIYVADYCTSCRTDLFFSYRKEGNLAGRMLAVIGIRAGEEG